MPTLKESPSEGSSVTVRQVPLTQIESPSFASCRIERQFEIVKEYPPPPEDVLSRGEMEEIAMEGLI